MKKWLGLVILSCLLVLASCSSNDDSNNKVIKNNTKGDKEKVTVIPQDNSKDYQTIHSKTPSQTRGYIGYGVTNRKDIDEMEMGLMSLSKEHFSPDKYAFQEGRFLSENEIDGMLGRKSKKTPNGLNPPLGKGSNVQEQAMNSPKELSYVLEQDYLTKESDNKYKLGGISLAISFNSVYQDKVMDSKGQTYDVDVDLDTSKVKADAKNYAQKVVQRVRQNKNLKNVPIFVTLYLEASPDSLVPGYFFDKAYVGQGNSNIGGWQTVNQKYALFPSVSAGDKHKEDEQSFDKFKSDVQNYFDNFIGITGEGYYKDNELSNLTFNINLKFYDKTEIVGFTQYVASLLQSKFPFDRSIPVQIYIKSNEQPESIIVKNPDMDKPFVHVYHQ
ncbi:CamS family sex pheromone protein [Scopulibacillus cellulosilyticus]|uniref:CamS family sex pheromone protein n=1 Tax=Scopulibacillus cellulosilyticus TaxID=2665665 RepID=A0ABW2PVP7_9BACL